MKTSILKWLSCSLVVLLFCACAKTKIKNMKWGKYQMTLLCEYENGNRDTIYGSRKNKTPFSTTGNVFSKR